MITFRKAKEEDLAIIRDIACRTWPSTYDSIVGNVQVQYLLEKLFNHGALLAQLMEGHTYLLALLEDEPVGFAGFSKVDPEHNIYKLHKLYVLPGVHGKGVGKVLVNEVVSQAKRAGGRSLLLNVNVHNKALHFYEHAGFKIKEAVTVDMGNGSVVNDYVMELPLSGN